jgi:hypothetical protein
MLLRPQGFVKEGRGKLGITMFIPQFEVSRQVLAMFFAIKKSLGWWICISFLSRQSGVLQ